MKTAKEYGDYRTSHAGRGTDYDESFERISHRRAIWRLEQAFLGRILRRHFFAPPRSYLDFACGTGRLLAFMEPQVEKSTGIDIAASMLEVCKRRTRRSELLCGDLTSGLQLEGKPFDLVTAFRFFPNAEPELRTQVLAALAAHTAPGSLLVFNNHLNWSSTVLRLLRLLGKPYGFEGVRSTDLIAAAGKAGFRYIEHYHCGVLPVIDHLNVLPEAVVLPFERFLSHVPWFTSLASDVVLVFRRER